MLVPFSVIRFSQHDEGLRERWQAGVDADILHIPADRTMMNRLGW
jgi:hypothetical protein